VIDTETGTVALTIPVGNNPTRIDLSSDGRRLYVTTSEGISTVPTDALYLLGNGGDDGPGWAVGGGIGVGGGGPVLPPLPGGGLGGGGTGPILPPIIPGGPREIYM
jgi:hypothetical protein